MRQISNRTDCEGNLLKIRVQIDELLLLGLALDHWQQATLQAAFKHELGLLLAENGLWRGAMHAAPVGSLILLAKSDPAIWGKQIAKAVYAGLDPQLQMGAAAGEQQIHLNRPDLFSQYSGVQEEG
jgi:hypothetical protein